MLAKEVVDDPSLEALKVRMDAMLGSLIWWLAALAMPGGLELGDLPSPLQPKPCCDSVMFLQHFQVTRGGFQVWHLFLLWSDLVL